MSSLKTILAILKTRNLPSIPLGSKTLQLNWSHWIHFGSYGNGLTTPIASSRESQNEKSPCKAFALYNLVDASFVAFRGDGLAPPPQTCCPGQAR